MCLNTPRLHNSIQNAAAQVSIKYYENAEEDGAQFCLPGDGEPEMASQKKGQSSLEETELGVC